MSYKVNIKKMIYRVNSAIFISKIVLWIIGISLLMTIIQNHPFKGVVIFLIGMLIYRIPEVISIIAFKNKEITKTQFKVLLSGLTPRQFEIFCYELFMALGYDAYLLPDGPDGGKDVILNKKIYVECKRYNKATVGREICQKLLGAITGDKMESGIIFTIGKINSNAKEFLRKIDNIQIWDFEKIYYEATTLPSHKLFDIIYTASQSEDVNLYSDEDDMELAPEMD